MWTSVDKKCQNPKCDNVREKDKVNIKNGFGILKEMNLNVLNVMMENMQLYAQKNVMIFGKKWI